MSSKKMMKEVVVSKGIKTEIKEVEVPQPGAEQVVIRVVVSGSNPKDWYVHYLHPLLQIPLISCLALNYHYQSLSNMLPSGNSPSSSPTTPLTQATTSPASCTPSDPTSTNSSPATASRPSTRCSCRVARSQSTPSGINTPLSTYPRTFRSKKQRHYRSRA